MCGEAPSASLFVASATNKPCALVLPTAMASQDGDVQRRLQGEAKEEAGRDQEEREDAEEHDVEVDSEITVDLAEEDGGSRSQPRSHETMLRHQLEAASSENERLLAMVRECTEVNRRFAMERSALESDLLQFQQKFDESEKQRKKLAKEQQEKMQDVLCVVCWESKKTIAFHPCGHVAACKLCSTRILRTPLAACPTCRGVIQSAVSVYL
mmetsp:Transcript_36963/g.95763  ORF Transcript_36963/g.95763 Transcript_36963/m.95763 type:complete len:211 (-) Transcript_36963:52-684(-)